MPVLIVPAALRNTSNGIERFNVSGRTLRDVFNAVRKDAPELYSRLVEDGEMRLDIAVAIDGTILEETGLYMEVAPDAEIYLVAPIGGGA
jgi:molybdopterin converting factor small subunit